MNPNPTQNSLSFVVIDMGVLSKNLLRPLSNFRFPISSTFNNLFISKGHDPDFKTADAAAVEDNHMLLLKRLHGSTVGSNAHYFSSLSPQDFSPIKKFYLPLFEDFNFVVGSCGGQVCLDNGRNESVFWKPSTEEVKIIPSGHMKRYSYIALRHSFSSGFGYDSQSHDFKLIRFINSFSELEDDSYELNEYLAELYSLKSDSWKYIDFPSYFVLRNPSAHINGYSYWLASGNTENFILSFDFTNEEFNHHGLPSLGNTSLHFDFVEFDGNLGVIVFPKLGTEKCFELWLSNGKSWIKELDICVPGAERPLGFWKNNQVLFFEGINRQLIVYDMTTGKATNLHIYDYPGIMQLIKV